MNGFPKTVRVVRSHITSVPDPVRFVAGDEAHGVWNASDVRSDDAHCLGESVHPAIVDLPRTPCSGGTPAGRAVRPRGPPDAVSWAADERAVTSGGPRPRRRPFRPIPYGLPAPGQRPHGPVQLHLRSPVRRA